METWWDLTKAYSLAQLDYPEGLGMRRVLIMKDQMFGWRPLHEIPPQELQKLINKLREAYVKLNHRADSGEQIQPDTNKDQRNDTSKNKRKNGSWREKIR